MTTVSEIKSQFPGARHIDEYLEKYGDETMYVGDRTVVYGVEMESPGRHTYTFHDAKIMGVYGGRAPATDSNPAALLICVGSGQDPKFVIVPDCGTDERQSGFSSMEMGRDPLGSAMLFKAMRGQSRTAIHGRMRGGYPNDAVMVFHGMPIQLCERGLHCGFYGEDDMKSAASWIDSESRIAHVRIAGRWSRSSDKVVAQAMEFGPLEEEMEPFNNLRLVFDEDNREVLMQVLNNHETTALLASYMQYMARSNEFRFLPKTIFHSGTAALIVHRLCESSRWTSLFWGFLDYDSDIRAARHVNWPERGVKDLRDMILGQMKRNYQRSKSEPYMYAFSRRVEELMETMPDTFEEFYERLKADFVAAIPEKR